MALLRVRFKGLERAEVSLPSPPTSPGASHARGAPGCSTCQAGTAACPLGARVHSHPRNCPQGSFPPQGMSPGPGHPQGSLYIALFQLFSAAVTTRCHPPDLARSQRSPPHTNPTPAGVLGWFRAFSCRKPQTKALSCSSVGFWAGGRGGGGGAEIGLGAGLVGPVGPAGPCPWHPDTPCSPLSLSLPLPGWQRGLGSITAH